MTATATSSRVLAVAAALAALASAAALVGLGLTLHRTDAGSNSPFAWLHPAPPPGGWQTARLPSGTATLAYPRGWHSIRSDAGTVSAAIRGPDGAIRGYLNATPQQASETLSNWATFRIAHNRDEGDVHVTSVAAATNLSFHDAAGSCVIDDYTSSSAHQYREIACLVAGSHATTVIVGAAPPGQWSHEAPALERSISAFAT